MQHITIEGQQPFLSLHVHKGIPKSKKTSSTLNPATFHNLIKISERIVHNELAAHVFEATCTDRLLLFDMILVLIGVV
jgi:hypothetical protein